MPPRPPLQRPLLVTADLGRALLAARAGEALGLHPTLWIAALGGFGVLAWVWLSRSARSGTRPKARYERSRAKPRDNGGVIAGGDTCR